MDSFSFNSPKAVSKVATRAGYPLGRYAELGFNSPKAVSKVATQKAADDADWPYEAFQ